MRTERDLSEESLSIPPQKSIKILMLREMSWPYFNELNARLLGVVFPTIMSTVLIFSIQTISMMFVSNMNDQAATAGVGLAIIFVNLSTMTVLMGLNYAMGVLIPVSYGQKDLQDCERVLQRGRLLCLIFYLPLIILQLYCYRILISMGQEEEVAQNAHNYGMFLFGAMGFFTQFNCYQ